MKKKLIIIGGGTAGFAAGIYGELNGYKTEIYEKHLISGGQVTAWRRGDYIFDGCLHWFMGSSPGVFFYDLWRELGIIPSVDFVYPELFAHLEDARGNVFHVYADTEKLYNEMIKIAPEDRTLIREFIKGIELFSDFDPPLEKAKELWNPVDWIRNGLKLLPFAAAFPKYKNMNVHDFRKKFKNPVLRNFMHRLIPDLDDFPMVALLYILGYKCSKRAGFPRGGSLAVAKAMEKRYLESGGTLHLKKSVKKIHIENGSAKGIYLSDGAFIPGDYVISTCDSRHTHYDLIGEKYLNKEVKNRYKTLKPFDPLLKVWLGVNRDLSSTPYWGYYETEDPRMIAGRSYKWWKYNHYCIDSAFAPAGKSVCLVTFPADYERWGALTRGSEAYKSAKREALEAALSLVEEKIPGIRDDVEKTDVATPLTWERYTNVWRGAYEGWEVTTSEVLNYKSKEVKGLKNFYHIGQWLAPGGGMPPAAVSGRDVIQMILKNNGISYRQFRSGRPAS